MRVPVISLTLLLTPAVFADAGQQAAQLEQDFGQTVRPFVQAYCLSCHGAKEPEGDLNLSHYATVDSIAKAPLYWKLVLERLEAGEMPPKKAKLHPIPEERQKVIEWIHALRKHEATRSAGDPGPVYARRLNNAEFDYTVHDLTGVDIRPAKEFPVDPANEAGFDNSGESLTMTPALLKKYLEAARRVSEHLVLKPDGIEFAPHPVVADTDRDKFCVNRIVRFYQRQKTDYADYFHAAWRYKHASRLAGPATGRPAGADATLNDIALEAGISPKYLATVWSTLTESPEQIGPIATLQSMWRDLPPDPAQARAGCERMRDYVLRTRALLVPRVNNLTAPRIQNGSQPLVLWKNRQMAADRRRYAGGALKLVTGNLPRWTGVNQAISIYTPPAALDQVEPALHRFCSTFPDAFYVSERARVYLDLQREKEANRTGRLLSAGFHSQMGYFRDDQPLYDMILSPDQQRELDRLWRELDFVASAPVRQYTGFIWFERTDSSFMRDPEFDFARAEDKDCTSPEKMRRLEEAYLAKAIRNNASETALQAIRDYFAGMSATFRWMEQAQRDAEPMHLAALQDFAARAYRRPLSQGERAELVDFYRSLRQKEGLTHEEAIRDTLASVLMSPHFCYRLDLPLPGDGPLRPLDDHALASRLSYFLWSSMPDRELLDLAAAGQLRKPEVLAAQARRMLKDDRIRRFATEFAGNWLDFRRFQEHNAVDRARFPTFDDELRQSMFEEPIRFFVDVAANNRSVLDFLYADHTFVNPPVAKHYGMPPVNDWTRVDGASQYGRGGLLPMAVFLTRNSPGLRTSPVKRGYWVVRKVLGEHIPPPPPTVPELPADESKLGELTLRQTLERHRADPSCAACHERFDSLGLVFEGFGPVGERRSVDLGGKPVDTWANFPGGGEGAGFDGLRSYIRERRQDDFVNHLCRELLAYGLGRTLLLSDENTVAAMKSKLAAGGYRFENLIESVVTSPQFLTKRAGAQVAKE
jgi:hypothetical protein